MVADSRMAAPIRRSVYAQYPQFRE